MFFFCYYKKVGPLHLNPLKSAFKTTKKCTYSKIRRKCYNANENMFSIFIGSKNVSKPKLTALEGVFRSKFSCDIIKLRDPRNNILFQLAYGISVPRRK